MGNSYSQEIPKPDQRETQDGEISRGDKVKADGANSLNNDSDADVVSDHAPSEIPINSSQTDIDISDVESTAVEALKEVSRGVVAPTTEPIAEVEECSDDDEMKTDESLVLDNNQFLIYNKLYHNARLAQWGTKGEDAGTFEHALNPDQLWTLEPHPDKKGCYYIVNEVHSQHRIADWKHKFIVYDGHLYDDQLFRFVPSGNNDGFYHIYNYLYPNDKIAKYGVGDGSVSMYSGPMYPDQLWRLVPRFKANFYTNEVFHFDNRQGTSPITREVSVTTGIERSTTSAIRSKTTFKQSIKASLSAAFAKFNIGVKATTEFSAELEESFSETYEQSWSKTEKITFTIPPGKNYKVMQHMVHFDSRAFSYDSCSLLTSIKIFESTGEQFEDPDDFIISHVQ